MQLLLLLYGFSCCLLWGSIWQRALLQLLFLLHHAVPVTVGLRAVKKSVDVLLQMLRASFDSFRYAKENAHHSPHRVEQLENPAYLPCIVCGRPILALVAFATVLLSHGPVDCPKADSWFVYVRTFTCMYVCMYVHMYVWKYVCMYVCMFVCMYVGRYVCMYVCMYLMLICFHCSDWLSPLNHKAATCNVYVDTYVHTCLQIAGQQAFARMEPVDANMHGRSKILPNLSLVVFFYNCGFLEIMHACLYVCLYVCMYVCMYIPRYGAHVGM